MNADLDIEFDLETDGRWIAEVMGVPGVLAYGSKRGEAGAKAEALAQAVVQDKPRDEDVQGWKPTRFRN